MVIVIVTLLIMTGIVAQLMRQAVSARRQTRTELEYRQTSLLADAGIQRALAARQNNADYQGETWNVPEGIIHQTKTGRVTIEVSEQQIQAVAVYPANSDTPLRFTRTQKVAP
jgi:type II secretory pathway component PulK